jgi:hypothetical protein
MTRPSITLDHGGVSYIGIIMRVTRTTFGTEDHGILTAMLHCEAQSTGVAIGGYSLDKYDEESKRRRGTAYGLDHLVAIMRTAGARTWEDVAGREVIVLHEGTSIYGSAAAGFASLDGERVLIFEEHAREWHAAHPEAVA